MGYLSVNLQPIFIDIVIFDSVAGSFILLLGHNINREVALESQHEDFLIIHGLEVTPQNEYCSATAYS